MTDSLENLKQTIEDKYQEALIDVKATRDDLLQKIESHEKNEILVAIKALNNRLSMIEEKLEKISEDG